MLNEVEAMNNKRKREEEESDNEESDYENEDEESDNEESDYEKDAGESDDILENAARFSAKLQAEVCAEHVGLCDEEYEEERAEAKKKFLTGFFKRYGKRPRVEKKKKLEAANPGCELLGVVEVKPSQDPVLELGDAMFAMVKKHNAKDWDNFKGNCFAVTAKAMCLEIAKQMDANFQLAMQEEDVFESKSDALLRTVSFEFGNFVRVLQKMKQCEHV